MKIIVGLVTICSLFACSTIRNKPHTELSTKAEHETAASEPNEQLSVFNETSTALIDALEKAQVPKSPIGGGFRMRLRDLTCSYSVSAFKSAKCTFDANAGRVEGEVGFKLFMALEKAFNPMPLGESDFRPNSKVMVDELICTSGGFVAIQKCEAVRYSLTTDDGSDGVSSYSSVNGAKAGRILAAFEPLALHQEPASIEPKFIVTDVSCSHVPAGIVVAECHFRKRSQVASMPLEEGYVAGKDAIRLLKALTYAGVAQTGTGQSWHVTAEEVKCISRTSGAKTCELKVKN